MQEMEVGYMEQSKVTDFEQKFLNIHIILYIIIYINIILIYISNFI